VRQAFQRLAVEGIMTIEEFRGASVRRLGKSEIIQLYEVREVLEGLAARGAATNATAKAKNNLVRLQSKMDGSEESGDWETFVQLNQQWHQEITNACKNAYVKELMNRLNVPINRLLSQVYPKLEEIASVNQDHREITEAILEGAEEAAEKLMRRHIRGGFMLRRVRNLPDTK
jgi:DNA-binding GntR family transcriptional regulator